MTLRPEQKTDAGKEERMYDGSGVENLGRRRFNTLGYQVRKLEQRVRVLEAHLATAHRPERRGGVEGPRSEKETPNVRGSRS